MRALTMSVLFLAALVVASSVTGEDANTKGTLDEPGQLYRQAVNEVGVVTLSRVEEDVATQPASTPASGTVGRRVIRDEKPESAGRTERFDLCVKRPNGTIIKLWSCSRNVLSPTIAAAVVGQPPPRVFDTAYTKGILAVLCVQDRSLVIQEYDLGNAAAELRRTVVITEETYGVGRSVKIARILPPKGEHVWVSLENGTLELWTLNGPRCEWKGSASEGSRADAASQKDAGESGGSSAPPSQPESLQDRLEK